MKMMIKKAVVLVCVTLFCLAAPILAEEPFQVQIDAAKDKAAFFVAYDRATGEPFAVIESPGYKVLKEGKTPSIALDDFKTLLEELGKSGVKDVETISSTVIYVHGSPGCYIKTASGGWKCICPR
jgi:hypothetical protein